MPDLQPQNIGIGLLFPYEDPVDPEEFDIWLQDQDYTSRKGKRDLNVGRTPGGSLAVQGPGPFAVKDNFHVLFNPKAELEGYPDVSFITFKDSEGGDFESISEDVNEFLSEFDFVDISDISQFELTYNGKIRIEKGTHEFSNYFDTDDLEALADLGASKAKGTAAVFESVEANSREDGWYRLLLDTEQTSNPRLWFFKLTLRVDEIGDVDITEINSTIETFIDRSGGD